MKLMKSEHSPSLSNNRCNFHILLDTVSILLFGIINPLPLLKYKYGYGLKIKTMLTEATAALL